MTEFWAWSDGYSILDLVLHEGKGLAIIPFYSMNSGAPPYRRRLHTLDRSRFGRGFELPNAWGVLSMSGVIPQFQNKQP